MDATQILYAGLLETPDYAGLDNPIEHRPVPGIGFHRPDDGVLFYYDRPLMFVAFVEGHQCVVNLIEDEFKSRQETPLPYGYMQYLVVQVSDENLHAAYANKRSLRSLFEQPEMKTWLIHVNWCFLGEFDGHKEWFHAYRVKKDIPIPDDLKPGVGLTFDHAIVVAED